MTRLISLFTMPISPVKNAVVAPTTSTVLSAVSDNSNNGDMRATMKMPAVTIVAAWISAEIGVGPSIESGSHTCSGTWADLPMAPMNRQMQISVMTDHSQGEVNTQALPNTASAPDQMIVSLEAISGSPVFANTVA